jgi:hypothetical protein
VKRDWEHQPGNASAPKQGETLTETPKRPRSEDSTPTKMARPPKRPRHSSRPRNFKKAPTNTKIAIFKETYPEDMLTEYDQDNILEELGRVFCGTPAGELPHLKPTDCREVHLYTIHTYIGCPRRNLPDFRRVFLLLKYADITQNTYVQS